MHVRAITFLNLFDKNTDKDAVITTFSDVLEPYMPYPVFKTSLHVSSNVQRV